MAIVQQLTAASGLDIFLRDGNGNLTDPISITFDIKEPAGTTVHDDVAGFKRSIGHYDARNAVIPSGFDTTSAWQIIWTFTSTGGVTKSAIEEFTVTAGLSSSFTNVDEISNQIREDIAITAGEFTETQIEIFIVKSLNRLNRRLLLTGTTLELIFNDSTGTITPTPNADIQDLIVLQAECLITGSRQASAVSKGIRVRDGDSEIDTTAGFGGHNDVSRNLCGDLDKAIEDYLWNKKGAAQNGQIVWYGNQRIQEDMDHDGQGSQLTRDFSSPFDPTHSHHDIPNRSP
jgi:hypothetical protein